MALTTDQQAQVEIQVAVQTAVEALRHTNQLALEAKRAETEAKRISMDLVRLAKETLVENRRNLPADAREITASDIISFATALSAHVNA